MVRKRSLVGVFVRLTATAGLAAAIGCGGAADRGAVKGKVTIKGQPLTAGDISFVNVSPGGGPSAGAAILDGNYQIAADQGPVAGEYQVQIRAFRGTGKRTWDGMGDEKAPVSQKKFVEEMEQYVPAKYNDASELKATIVAGRVNEHDFDLQLAPVSKAK
jgi:hypothetical protein